VCSFVFELAFTVLGFFFLLVAALSGWGLVQMLRAGQRNQLYLAAASQEAPLEVGHLTPGLRRVAEETRLLRISLEAPVREIADLRGGEVQDLDAVDNMLMNISRQVADWLAMVDGLSQGDRDSMQDRGVSAEPVRMALHLEGLAFERQKIELQGHPPMDRRIEHIVRELGRIETALQVVSLKPYR